MLVPRSRPTIRDISSSLRVKSKTSRFCGHAFLADGLRNDDDAALDHPPQGDLGDRLVVRVGDADKRRVGEEAVLSFREGAPGLDLHASGPPRRRPLNSLTRSGSMTSATPTPPGYSPAAPTSKLSKHASATAASAPPRNTSTPCPTPTTPHWTHSSASETAHRGRFCTPFRLGIGGAQRTHTALSTGRDGGGVALNARIVRSPRRTPHFAVRCRQHKWCQASATGRCSSF